ncbi:hypothetical protein [Aquimarina rhabdastrellae]
MQEKKTSKVIGCFTFLVVLIIAFIAYAMISIILPIKGTYLFSFILLVISYSIYKITKHQTNFLPLSSIVIILLLFFIPRLSSPTITKPKVSNEEEQVFTEKKYEKGDSIILYSQTREWVDNYGNDYKGTFSVREKDYINSKIEYLNYTKSTIIKSWTSLYDHLIKKDTPHLDLIIERLSLIQKEHNLNKLDFAEMVVTFIQDIPYALVFSEECQAPENYEQNIRSILEDCSDCCIGNIPYGIQNPVGFMGNLKGDCDTRTVIIYALLSHFGYDVAILNSQYYKHSILGLNLPASGDYKIHQGKRYYTWETTNKYYTLGTLPESFDNINHWDIVLTNTSSYAN